MKGPRNRCVRTFEAIRTQRLAGKLAACSVFFAGDPYAGGVGDIKGIFVHSCQEQFDFVNDRVKGTARLPMQGSVGAPRFDMQAKYLRGLSSRQVSTIARCRSHTLKEEPKVTKS